MAVIVVDAVNSSCLDVNQGPQDKDTKKKFKQKSNDEEEYELSRYKPILRQVIEVRETRFVQSGM